MANIVLCGKAASGKDYLRKKLESRGFKHQISYTTRPPREGEINGKDYWFIDINRFQQMIDFGEFYEYVKFNDWFYGTTKEQWYSLGSVFIMTPAGLSKILPEDRKNVFVIYIEIDSEIRKQRLIERSDNNDSLQRRMDADEKDFFEFSNYDIIITSPNF